MAGVSVKLPPSERATRSRALVLQAATARVVGYGAAALTVDFIVQRTGLARTTIYRHWPTRDELFSAVLQRLAEAAEVPDTGTLYGDLLEFFNTRIRLLEEYGPCMQTLHSVIEVAKHDPRLCDVVSQGTRGMMRTLVIMLERARKRGEVRAALNLELAAELLLGAVYLHRGYRNEPASELYVAELIHTLMHGMLEPRAADRS